jgi:hypothetical protein
MHDGYHARGTRTHNIILLPTHLSMECCALTHPCQTDRHVGTHVRYKQALLGISSCTTGVLRLRSADAQGHTTTQQPDPPAQRESVLSVPALTQKHLIVSIKIPPCTSDSASHLARALAPCVIAEGRAEAGRVMFTVSDAKNAQVCRSVCVLLEGLHVHDSFQQHLEDVMKINQTSTGGFTVCCKLSL